MRGTRAGLTVAIKRLHSSLHGDVYFQKNFQRELRELQALNNVHVLSFYGAGLCNDGRLFLATEYCERGSLEGVLLDHDVPWGRARAMTCAMQCAMV